MEKLPKSLRKHIRKEKARLRRELLNKQEREEKFRALFEKWSGVDTGWNGVDKSKKY